MVAPAYRRPPPPKFCGIAEGVHVLPQDVIAVYVPIGGYSTVRLVMRGGHAIDIASPHVEPFVLASTIRKDLDKALEESA